MAKKAKSRTIPVRLISMALTGYYKTLIRPRTHRPLSMLKYDPVGLVWDSGEENGNEVRGIGNWWKGEGDGIG
ncbi:predicted protein [Sclerotinia sclerotiorum 1980 UF-70]|uniref:Large ribosomal subunit protein bL33m n=1 Tax=Sclerotinia sclerotiorum (strain ATCC 18683 / 1980 / Ss-1) TaxID=665079 RepID=A7EAA6_SCLS1|nr:predicted protein [Sclerotinia sclerotiorum 1980 UF-70]EDN99384.1 predicted protein [Sclerotinia sclerotiorum 1980 UF-70]